LSSSGSAAVNRDSTWTYVLIIVLIIVVVVVVVVVVVGGVVILLPKKKCARPVRQDFTDGPP
jgi:flagellar basal body-associated protein FliL